MIVVVFQTFFVRIIVDSMVSYKNVTNDSAHIRLIPTRGKDSLKLVSTIYDNLAKD